MAVALWACGGPDAGQTPQAYPDTGLVLLSLQDGSPRGSAHVGADPVAVTVSDDGHTAYLADSSPGDVYAASLPNLKVRWKTHTGGAPFGLLVHQGRLYVTLFDTATIAELDLADGRVLAMDRTITHPAAITVDSTGLVVAAGGDGFGIALAGGTLWTADYRHSLLQPGGEGNTIPLPLVVHPFWLAAGAGGTLLIAAEGEHEDSDPGAVLSYDAMKGTFTTLGRPRDPDQVVESGSTIFVPAHGDHEVVAIHDGATDHWAGGASAVALAPDTALNLLVVVVNSHE